MLVVHGVLLRVARVLRHSVRVRCAVPDTGITQYDLRTLSPWATGNNSPEGRNHTELAGEDARSRRLSDAHKKTPPAEASGFLVVEVVALPSVDYDGG